MDHSPSPPQPGVREPRENRGRLRHCNGLQTPTGHCPALNKRRREGGSEVTSEVRISVWLCSSWLPKRSQLLRQEKDEASPFRVCETGFLNAFILRFAGDEGFFVAPTFLSADATHLP